MNIITKNPIKYARTSSADGIDSNSLKEDVQLFQDWMDTNHPKWVWYKGNKSAISLNKGIGYGFFGENTKIAWNTYGTEYISFLRSKGMKIPQIQLPKTGGISNQKDTQPMSDNSTTTNPKEEDKEKKKIKLGVKIAIGVGVFAIIGVIVYFATRKK